MAFGYLSILIMKDAFSMIESMDNCFFSLSGDFYYSIIKYIDHHCLQSLNNQADLALYFWIRVLAERSDKLKSPNAVM